MPNYSGVWDLRQQGVAVKGGLWREPPQRAVFAGGVYNAYDIMDYVDITSTGNATDFGDLTAGVNALAVTSGD